MHARSETLYPRSDRFDHVRRLMRDYVALAAQREQGFSGMLILDNRKANKVVGITLWESEVEMLASTQGEDLQDQISRLIIHLRRPPEFEDYDVEVL